MSATDRVSAWSLTASISPRPVVRLAAVDAYGQYLNTYVDQGRTDGEAPDGPWAVYLADRTGSFRLLCFDLDAGKGGHPEADATTLCGWLTAAGLAHVVTRSGPAGGRHVWVGLAEAVSAITVDVLARLLRGRLHSLDLAPLTNPATGCARPPGAPHRHGGRSTLLEGDIGSLTEPTVTAADVDALVATLADHLGSDRGEPVDDVRVSAPLPVDRHGRLHLPGVRRELPAASAAALACADASADASAVLWRVLTGAAHARWRCEDLMEHVAAAPGLAHLRSQGQGPGRPRRVRGPRETHALMHRQWDKAVSWVAAHPPSQLHNDPTFEPRAAAVVADVELAQARADAAPGRWTAAGGPADRRVLDALCSLALQAVSAVVEADIRRLALMCGIGRETARTALKRLAADGFLEQIAPAEGRRGARWALGQPSSTDAYSQSRSQALPRPPSTAEIRRTRWLEILHGRLESVNHDAFVFGGGLGHHAGQMYAALGPDPSTTTDLARQFGCSRARVLVDLERLRTFRLASRTRRGWCRPSIDRRRRVAVALGTEGRLADRARRYAAERDVWAWWLAELERMRSRRRSGGSSAPVVGQLTLLALTPQLRWPVHPRRHDGRADFAAARRGHDRYGDALHRAATSPPGRSAATAKATPVSRRRTLSLGHQPQLPSTEMPDAVMRP